jgi:hypothetical protein
MIACCDREGAIVDLMAQLKASHRRVDRANSLRILSAFVCWLIVMGATFVISILVHSGVILGVVFFAATASYFYVYFVLITRWDNAQCRELGFVCPYCEQPLFVREDGSRKGQRRFLETGECPHCFQRIEPII